MTMISVLMSTYNTPNKWLSKAIDSILDQTFTDFEFIIIDDCSTNDIDLLKNKYTDNRIVWVKNKENLGLTKSLNKILRMAKGKYIARMDSDDISLPNRFSVQVDYMDKHPEIIVCGSYRRAFGIENKDEIWNIPNSREEQQAQLFFFNCGLTHPTAMFRRSMLDKYNITYNENYIKAQDYGMWVQCTRYAPMAIIPKVLLMYRKSDQQISVAGRKNQLENDKKVKLDQLVLLGIDASEEQKKIHIAFCSLETDVSFSKIETWINYLRKMNNQIGYFDKRVFDILLSRHWYDWCKKAYIFEGKNEVRKAYKKSSRLSFLLKDKEIFLKQFIMKLIRK